MIILQKYSENFFNLPKVFLFNGIFLLLGLLIMVFGGLVYTQTVEFSSVTQSSPAPAGFLIALGAAVCVISFFGSSGALMESYCLLMTFSWIVGLIIAAEVVSIGLVYRYRNHIEEATVTGFLKLIDEYKDNNSSKIVVDEIQRDLSCCGANGFRDWDNELPSPGGNITRYPASCCAASPGDDDGCFDPFTTSCRDAIEGAVISNIHALIAVVGTFLLIQLVSLVFACCMARSTRSDYYRFV